ncbi:hypothetical protein [Clostridium sp. JN-9]|uniref:hypothetical protein n=1 Tax=Clostridium sp. JN-9 TaxID=2507159 RepID=UPI000FFDFA17|nr:hypothetical protein [Clostridium sp. JN-9]QAT40734.1 hypothetical protein EQM05_10945 [Clostridium sp. JN-9]
MFNKKLIACVLGISITVTPMLSMNQPVFAADSSQLNTNNSYELKPSESIPTETKEYIDSLSSIDQLNNYINNIAKNYSLDNVDLKNNKTTLNNGKNIAGAGDIALKAAWYAAAKAARLAGYSCSATLVEHYVLGQDYKENSGQFSTKILQSSEFRGWNGRVPSIAFTSGDLFYSLHLVDICYSAMSSQGAMVHIHDKFDFKLDMQYASPFASIVNNWAWLCQHADVLVPIAVDIYFVAP